MKISARSVLTTGVATITASAVAIAPSVQPPPSPKPEPALQLAATVQPLAEPPAPRLLQILLTDPARLLGPAVTPGTISPPPAPVEFAIAPNLADTIDNIYLAVEPWVRYGFQVAADVLGWVPWVGWLSGQIMVFYTFGEGIVASGAFNIADWLRGDGGVVENLVDFGIDVGLAFAWLGIDEYNYFLPPLPPGLPRPPRPPHEGRPGPNLLALLGLAPQSPDELANPVSDPVGGITDVLVNANETFFDVTADVTEFGLFDLAEPVLRELRLDLVADQIDLYYNDLLKPATIQEVEGISDLLTVPENFLSDVEAGKGPLEAIGTQADFVADTVVTRVGNAGDVAGSYVQKQIDYFTDNFPTPGGTADVAELPKSAQLALKGVDTGDEVTKAAKDTTRIVRSLAATPRKAARDTVQAQGEVRGAITDATAAVPEAAETGERGAVRESLAATPRTVAKGLRDAGQRVAGNVHKAANDVRDAVRSVNDAAGDSENDED